jgi:hypothetical protein
MGPFVTAMLAKQRSMESDLRQRLEASDGALSDMEGMYEALRGIEQRLDDIGPGHAAAPSAESAAGIETLMLLRQLLITSGRKGDLDSVTGELKRQGFTPWMPSRGGANANSKSDASSERSEAQQQSLVDEIGRLKELLEAEQRRSSELQTRLSRFKRMTLWGRLAFAFRGL